MTAARLTTPPPTHLEDDVKAQRDGEGDDDPDRGHARVGEQPLGAARRGVRLALEGEEGDGDEADHEAGHHHHLGGGRRSGGQGEVRAVWTLTW